MACTGSKGSASLLCDPLGSHPPCYSMHASMRSSACNQVRWSNAGLEHGATLPQHGSTTSGTCS
eukprot:scaffold247598_cov15-Tisochrysis_lutea.AAC.2